MGLQIVHGMPDGISPKALDPIIHVKLKDGSMIASSLCMEDISNIDIEVVEKFLKIHDEHGCRYVDEDDLDELIQMC